MNQRAPDPSLQWPFMRAALISFSIAKIHAQSISIRIKNNPIVIAAAVPYMSVPFSLMRCDFLIQRMVIISMILRGLLRNKLRK